MIPTSLQQKTFLFLLVAVTLAFLWILWPFYGAILWGVVLAVLFSPLYRRLERVMGKRRNLAALATLLVILLIVILPVALLSAALVQEGLAVYERFQSGELDFRRLAQDALAGLPPWITNVLDRFDLSSLGAVQQRLSAALERGGQFFATRALGFGQNALDVLVGFFVMLYLLFFLLRDGRQIANRVVGSVPLDATLKRTLADKFTAVVRATVKGNIVVAAIQGALGGLIFWILGVQGALLWAVLMAFLALLPAVGSAIVWLPVALYFLFTGSIGRGIVLLVFGAAVIGLVDNILRPMLVGNDIKLPDYLVLISTLGGIAIFGLNGFVIGPMFAAMFIAVWDTVSGPRPSAPRR